MPGAGIAINEDCITEFESFKLRGKYSWITFKIDQGHVVIDETGQPESSFQDFASHLKKSEPRYGVTHYKYETPEDGRRSKVVFVHTTPSTSSIREKMIYAATKVEFKKALNGVQVEFWGSPEDVEPQAIQEKCRQFK